MANIVKRVLMASIPIAFITIPAPARALYYSWSDFGGFRFCVHRDGVTDCIWTRSIAAVPTGPKKDELAKASLKSGFDTREAVAARQQAEMNEKKWFPREGPRSQK